MRAHQAMAAALLLSLGTLALAQPVKRQASIVVG
jgi:hypothetical protein